MNNAKGFYDKFDHKLIQDFISGNKRIIEAILFIKKNLQVTKPANILDIGCGLGWSSYELGETFPEASILGLDLSDKLISRAKEIFGGENRRFLCQDLTSEFTGEYGKYDTVVMIDVFEHIPSEHRSGFYHDLKQKLDNQFLVFITCPTKYHQQYLREQNPAGLQPVDEDVDANVLQQFADEIGGELIHFTFKSIWNQNDYFHAIIGNHTTYGSKVNEIAPRVLSAKDRLEILRQRGISLDDYHIASESRLGKIKGQIRKAWK